VDQSHGLVEVGLTDREVRDTLVDLIHESRVHVPKLWTELDVIDVRPEFDSRGVRPAAKDLSARHATLWIASRNVALRICGEPHLREEPLVAPDRVVEEFVALLHLAGKLVTWETHQVGEARYLHKRVVVQRQVACTDHLHEAGRHQSYRVGEVNLRRGSPVACHESPRADAKRTWLTSRRYDGAPRLFSVAMRDAPEKTRFAVQMAVAARALVGATTDPHRKRVVARYAFVYLHDVVRFAPPWRNAVLQDARYGPTAEAALPALERLRRDWDHYQNIRHFLGAKRQPREPTDAAADQLKSFELWADIGELSVGTLIDDAVELYVQLAAATALAPIELDPKPSPELAEAMSALDALGEAGLLEMTATSFGAGKAGSFPVRQGGAVGRLIPLLNDIAENIQTLRAAVSKVGEFSVLDQLLRCQLPSEIDELLRLSVGPAPNAASSPEKSLLDLFCEPKKASEPREVLEQLRDSIAPQTRESLHDWRNRIGAHIDAETPWHELEPAIREMDLTAICELADHVLLWLELAATQPGGPVLLLLSARRMKGVIDAIPGRETSLPYANPDVDAGAVTSALPPPYVDSDSIVWVAGPMGSTLSPAVAGMIAGRNRELQERLAAAQAKAR
jgi:hypothetical protein